MDKRVWILVLAITALVGFAAADDEDAQYNAAQARMEAAAKAHRESATQMATRPTSRPVDRRPDFIMRLSALPPEAQPKSGTWDDASIAKAQTWISQHLLGKDVRELAVLRQRLNMTVQREGNSSDVLHYEIYNVFDPQKVTLFGFENWISFKTDPNQYSIFAKKSMADLAAKFPDLSYVIFIGDKDLNQLTLTWNEGDGIVFEGVIRSVHISQAHGPGGDHGVILVSLTQCHAPYIQPLKPHAATQPAQ